MGVIISKIEEINHIHWAELRKGRVTKATRVLAVDDTTVLIELANGEYTVAGRRHAPNGKWAVLEYGLCRFTGGVLDGLVRLGILTTEQVSDHKKSVKTSAEERERKYVARNLEEACKALGIPTPQVPPAA